MSSWQEEVADFSKTFSLLAIGFDPLKNRAGKVYESTVNTRVGK